MNRDETRLWISTTAARFPGLNDYFAKVPKDQITAVLADWSTAVENVEPEAASRFLQAMVAGEVEVPKWPAEWATLPATLRRWARENAPPDLSLPNYKKAADDPTFRCLACRDRGYGVEVFSPLWVRSHELAIESGLEGDWWQEGKRWCASNGRGPFTFTCDCGECDKGRQQIEKRKIKRVVYQKHLFCLVPGGGPNEWPAALEQFVKEYPMIEQAEWNPTHSYEEIVGGDY